MFLFGKNESEELSAAKGRDGNGSKGYGIDQAIALMRALPVDQNVELVVHVMRHTLESLNVHLPAIIDDAAAKEVALQERVEKLDAEIENLAGHIEARRQEIAAITASLKEIRTARDRLVLAQKTTATDDATTISTMPPPPPPLKIAARTAAAR